MSRAEGPRSMFTREQLAYIVQWMREHPCAVCEGTRGDCDDRADQFADEHGWD